MTGDTETWATRDKNLEGGTGRRRFERGCVDNGGGTLRREGGPVLSRVGPGLEEGMIECDETPRTYRDRLRGVPPRVGVVPEGFLRLTSTRAKVVGTGDGYPFRFCPAS